MRACSAQSAAFDYFSRGAPPIVILPPFIAHARRAFARRLMRHCHYCQRGAARRYASDSATLMSRHAFSICTFAHYAVFDAATAATPLRHAAVIRDAAVPLMLFAMRMSMLLALTPLRAQRCLGQARLLIRCHHAHSYGAQARKRQKRQERCLRCGAARRVAGEGAQAGGSGESGVALPREGDSERSSAAIMRVSRC